MKPFLLSRSLVVLAIAMAAALCTASPAAAQPAPPPAAGALPANIQPGTPLAEVVKLVQAGVDVPTIQSYIVNAPSPFNLDADKIIFLKDEGVPTEVVNAMMDRDKSLYASTISPPAAPVAPTPPPAPETPAPDPTVTDNPPPDTAPPSEDITANYFYDTLTPYGSWVDVDGFGQCWRPTIVIYDSGWRPYCDRGRWMYTDCGWYWDSDYSWGLTFHYGRWFHSPRFGWCWYPDTVWSPSWVTWRSDPDYCGWAPLPPFAVFHPGGGFFYRGISVASDFDFGLPADSFVFLPPGHFCDRQPRSFCVQPTVAAQIFHQTTVINNFNANGKTFINRGIAVDHIASVTHRSIQPIQVSTLPNAGRQGWRGEGYQRTLHGGNNANTYPSPSQFAGNGHVQSQTYNYQQPQQQQQTRQNQWPQNHNNYYNNNNTATAAGGLPQHGAQPLPERSYVAPTAPQPEPRQNYIEPAPRNYNPTPPPQPVQNQPQTRAYSGNNGNNGGGNNGGNSTTSSGNNRGSNKQNQ